MVRKFLFQLHLWAGLTLGIVFMLIGLSGSVGTLDPLFQAHPPAVQVTPARTPALDKGLAAARATVQAPQSTGAAINLPDGSHDPVIIFFGDQLPVVATDPSTGKVLATFSAKEPAWFTAILDFHNGLLLPGRTGRTAEGWLGLIMIFLGLTGLYIWWPKAGRWKYAFIVRRTAKGLRFHRELHGAAGIWTLVIYLLVTTTGLFFCFAQAQAVLTFVTGEEGQHFLEATPIATASAVGELIGPDAVLAAASKASSQPFKLLKMPGWEPGQPSLLPVIARTGVGPWTDVYLDPYHGTIIPNLQQPANKHTKLGLVLTDLHFGLGFGTVYRVLVFISGLMPLIFFVTGLMMWLKKRKSRLAMNQPMPDSVLEG
ncbi:MAG TPA: PepSY-associated TM helix domain-containing protein [Rhizomicrobium sp.]|nr:PepSY-associated TM helix domain-containing protein [Rhizomicrobium sp.]